MDSCVLIVDVAFSKVPGGMDAGKGLLASQPSKGAAQDMAQDISLGSKADEMIAAWKGSNVTYEDDSEPSGPAQDFEVICKQGQHADDSNDNTASEVRLPSQNDISSALPQ